jgi:hypothetical protein
MNVLLGHKLPNWSCPPYKVPFLESSRYLLKERFQLKLELKPHAHVFVSSVRRSGMPY